MQSLKSLIAIICVLGVAGLAVAAVANATSTSTTVTATVTIQNISLSVTSSVIDYGTIPLDSTKDTCQLGDTQTITNGGNVNEDFSIEGTDEGTGTSDWKLGASAGDKIYTQSFSTDSCSTFTPLTTSSYATIAHNIATSSTQDFDLEIHTPTATDDFNQHSVDVIVQATASS